MAECRRLPATDWRQPGRWRGARRVQGYRAADRGVAALGVAEAGRIDPEITRRVACTGPKVLQLAGVLRIRRPNDIGMNVIRIACAGRTFCSRIEAVAQTREDIVGETGMPGDDRE